MFERENDQIARKTFHLVCLEIFFLNAFLTQSENSNFVINITFVSKMYLKMFVYIC